MKYLKLLVLFLLPLTFVACDDDEEVMNLGNATVEFGEATITTRESTSMLQIPIVLTGDHNGTVRVTAKMSGSTANFENNKDVIVTTETLVMPEGVETVNFEAHLNVANDAIESGRSITFEIVSVEGATIGNIKTCTVELKENNPLEGIYTLSGYSPFDGAVSSEKCMLSMEEGINDVAYLDLGFGGLLTINLEEVIPGTKYNITIPGAQVIGTHSSYGNVLFPYCEFTGTGVTPYKTDIIGVYESGIITLNTPENFGVGFYVSVGWFGAYVAYTDKNGTLVPVTLRK